MLFLGVNEGGKNSIFYIRDFSTFQHLLPFSITLWKKSAMAYQSLLHFLSQPPSHPRPGCYPLWQHNACPIPPPAPGGDSRCDDMARIQLCGNHTAIWPIVERNWSWAYPFWYAAASDQKWGGVSRAFFMNLFEIVFGALFGLASNTWALSQNADLSMSI